MTSYFARAARMSSASRSTSHGRTPGVVSAAPRISSMKHFLQAALKLCAYFDRAKQQTAHGPVRRVQAVRKRAGKPESLFDRPVCDRGVRVEMPERIRGPADPRFRDPHEMHEKLIAVFVQPERIIVQLVRSHVQTVLTDILVLLEQQHVQSVLMVKLVTYLIHNAQMFKSLVILEHIYQQIMEHVQHVQLDIIVQEELSQRNLIIKEYLYVELDTIVLLEQVHVLCVPPEHTIQQQVYHIVTDVQMDIIVQEEQV